MSWRAPVTSYGEPENHDALVLGFVRFLGELRIRRINNARGGDPTANPINSSTNAATRSRTNAREPTPPPLPESIPPPEPIPLEGGPTIDERGSPSGPVFGNSI